MKCIKELAKKVIFGTLPASYILMFHHIVDNPDIKNSGCLLSNHRFQEIVLQYKSYCAPLEDLLRGKRKKVAITFDDGLSDLYDQAYPLLKAHAIPFTVFVVTDFLDRPGYLTTEQLRILSADPLVTIGSHGVSHQIFPSMTTSQKKKEMVDSRQILRKITGQKVDIFAYSHGQFDKETLKFARCYDYAMSVRGVPLNSLTANRYQMPRLNVENSTYKKTKGILDDQLCKSKN